MNKKNVNIKIDTVPYLPNIYLNEKDYIKKDFIDFSNAISANKIIFIINMNQSIINYTSTNNYQYYNDPNFLLYGIIAKNFITQNYYVYNIPPINFFFNNNITAGINYKVLSFRYISTEFDEILLQSIGYDITANYIKTPTSINNKYLSTTSLIIITPSPLQNVTLTIKPLLAYALNDIIQVSNTSNTLNYFKGTVLTYDTNSGILVINNIAEITGTFTSAAIYQVNLTGNEFFREIEIIDFSKNTFIVYLYYFNYSYPTDIPNANSVKYNNQNTNNIVNYNNFTNNIFYNNANWNVFIYPFVDNISGYTYIDTNPIRTQIIAKNSLYNYINTIDFSDVKLTNFKDNIDFIYLESMQSNSIKPIDNTYYLTKNIRSFNDYINNNKDDENIFISLNEINYFYYNSLENSLGYLNSNNNTTIKNFIKKNKTFVNTNIGTSFTMDNKISYLNTKYKYFNDTNYAQYISNVDLTEKIYEFNLIYCVDSYLDINSYILYVNDVTNNTFNEFSYVNGNLKKLLLLINPNLIYDAYKNSSDVNTNIINLTNNQVSLKINSQNKFIVEPIDNTQVTNLNTKSYVICRYLFILSYLNYTGITSKIQYYYIYINIAFYNSNYINIIDQFTSNTFDVCYVCRDYLSSTVTLSPTIFNVLKKTNMYQNIINWSFVDTKIYSFIYNFDNYSLYKNKENSIIINHFYYLLTNIKSNLKYNTCQSGPTGLTGPTGSTGPTGTCEYIINNMNDLVYEKINNFISNIIILNNTFNSLGYNKYFSRTDNIISIVTDTNIDKKYFDTFEYFPKINSYPGDYSYPSDNFYFTYMNYLPFGIYKAYKFNNSYPGNYTDFDTNIYDYIQNISTIVLYNYILLIRVSPPYEYDDKYNELVNENNFNNFINTNNSLFTNKSEMYLVFGDINCDIIYVQTNRILCYKLFNYYNGNNLIINRLQLYINTNCYNNFYEMNVIIESYPSKEINTMVLDYNNLKFTPHINDFIKDILTFDLLRFNNNLFNTNELNYNKEIIVNITNSNNNLYKFQTIINYCVYLIYLWKIIILIKKVRCYFIIINNINKYNYYTFPIDVPINSNLTLNDFNNIILNDIQELKDCCNYIYNLNFFTIPLSKLENFIALFNDIVEITEINLQNIQNLYYDNAYEIDITIKNIPLTIIYLENLIINFNEDKNNTKNLINELLPELNNNNLTIIVTNFLEKYNNSFNILESFENNILNLKPENELLFLIKNQTLIYLYNINSLFEIINFNKIFDNEFFNITINSLNLIKKNYIFSTTELETNLLYSYLCISTFINSLNLAIGPAGFNTFNLSVLISTEQQLINNINNYINNLPLTIDNLNLNNLLTQINILISTYPQLQNYIIPLPYNLIEFYYVYDMVYYLDKYVYLIKELLLTEAYKKQLLNLPINNIPQPYDVLSNNLNENIITIKNIINLIDKVYKNNDQQAIHDVLNINDDNINIDFYSQINLYSYNDHLQYLSNNFINVVVTPTTYSLTTNYTLTSNNYIYGFTINEEIFNMIELYYQNKNNFINTYKSIIENNILIHNSLNYGYINTPLYYTS